MVRPNQIVDRDGSKLSFMLFAQSEDQAARRALVVNFPRTLFSLVFGDLEVDNVVSNTELLTEGMVNRYIITVDTSQL